MPKAWLLPELKKAASFYKINWISRISAIY